MNLSTLCEVKKFLSERYDCLKENYDNTEYEYAKRYWENQMLRVKVEMEKIQSKIDNYLVKK